jgi:hypothetical protein
MKRKLTLIKASVLAVALGAAYSQATCYTEDAGTTCVSSGTLVDTITFCEGGTLSTGCNSTPTANVYAHSTWYNHVYLVQTSGTYSSTFYHPCGGPIHFTNPLNGQSSNTETCTFWQWGLFSNMNGGPWYKHYNGVNYNDATCSG